MRATLGRQWNWHRALRTIPGGRRHSRRRSFPPAIHLLYQQKHCERHNQKINDRIQKQSVIYRRRRRCFRRHKRRVMRPIETYKQVRKIYVTERQPDRRHDDVIHQRRHNFSKRQADNHAHREIDHIPAHRKSFKFLEHIYFLSRANPGVTQWDSGITWSRDVARQRAVTVARNRRYLAPPRPPRHTPAEVRPTQTAPAKSPAAIYPEPSAKPRAYNLPAAAACSPVFYKARECPTGSTPHS